MSLPRVVAFSASANRPSRTRNLVEAVAAELARHRRIDLDVLDLVDAGPGLGATARDGLSPAAARLIGAIEGADALIVGTPVYQGAYSGLFKHVFDFVEPAAMAGKPVVLTATGGGLRHALVVEHSLRPLFGFFAAHVAPTAVYAGPDENEDTTVPERIAAAARELDALLDIVRAPADA
ncbi:NAD(P)H-dependent oxidoreductase [Methylobacterium trifolii]|uniref:NAD(P)H-dependent oxidoreductase n=1 Tax=Methylobacterium trifolii TaxID=1003092 RepID=UPI001EDDA658|nr:NAD(P)H-dependent oxidoreductase [Methylobacterium trifolii]